MRDDMREIAAGVVLAVVFIAALICAALSE
jgi:hypothetical protein